MYPFGINMLVRGATVIVVALAALAGRALTICLAVLCVLVLIGWEVWWLKRSSPLLTAVTVRRGASVGRAEPVGIAA